MVMERITGESATSALRHRRYISEGWLLFFVGSLLDGLRLVHERGFIHRDIKPDNIYIRDDLSPVRLDFGSARIAVESRTQSLTALVTPGFAPFEQYQTDESAGRQGPWTDIYSLAATLYSAISGKRRVPDAFARVNAMISNLPNPLIPAVEVGHGRFSEQFLAAIDATLQVQPSDRPQNVDEWLALLPADARQVSTSSVSVLGDTANVSAKADNETVTISNADTANFDADPEDTVISRVSRIKTKLIVATPNTVIYAVLGIAVTAVVAAVSWCFVHGAQLKDNPDLSAQTTPSNVLAKALDDTQKASTNTLAGSK